MKDKLYQIDNILMRLEDYIHGKDGDDITKARKNVIDLLRIIDTTANEAKVFSSNAVLAVSLPLIDAGSGLEDLRTDSQVKYHCPRCKERVYYPMDCRKCFKEIIWRGNDR